MNNISSQDHKKSHISEPTLLRIPVYLQLLKRKYNRKGAFVSSSEIADKLDLKPIQVRKDLESAGAKGKPKIGYNALELIHELESFLGYNKSSEAFLIGCGNLGSALLGYSGFEGIGVNIIAAFDTNIDIVGTDISGHKIFKIDKLTGLADQLNVRIAILSVPGENAQEIADMLCMSGMKAIWNFTPVHLKVPEGVVVQNENIAASLSVLIKKLEVISEK